MQHDGNVFMTSESTTSRMWIILYLDRMICWEIWWPSRLESLTSPCRSLQVGRVAGETELIACLIILYKLVAFSQSLSLLASTSQVWFGLEKVIWKFKIACVLFLSNLELGWGIRETYLSRLCLPNQWTHSQIRQEIKIIITYPALGWELLLTDDNNH